MNKMLAQSELQDIEFANKVLLEHQQLIKTVLNESEEMLNTYIPIAKAYIHSIATIQEHLGSQVSNIIKSTRELGVVTKNTQNIINFCQSVEILNKTLTPDLIEKLRRITNDKSS